MKPFTINRNSWHYKLNKNFFNEDEHWMQSRWEPMHNNFCSYWRATVFRLFFATAMIAFLGSVVGTLGYLVYLEPVSALATVGCIIAVFALMLALAFISYISEQRKRKNQGKEPSQSLLAQKYRANKEKICPMVEYNE